MAAASRNSVSLPRRMLSSSMGEVEFPINRRVLRNDYGRLWTIYESADGCLTSDFAKQFLQDFAGICGSPYEDARASRLLNRMERFRKNGTVEYFELQEVLLQSIPEVAIPKSVFLSVGGVGGRRNFGTHGSGEQDSTSSLQEMSLSMLWDTIIDSVTSTLVDPAAAVDFTRLYSIIFHYCSSPQCDIIGLAKKVAFLMKIESIRRAKEIDKVRQRGMIMIEYAREWELYKKGATKLSLCFKQFDKTRAIGLGNCQTFLQISWMQWRVHVLAGRRETLIPLLLDKIRKERRTTSLSDNFLVNAEQKVKEMLQSQGSGSIEELGMSKETRNSAKDIERFKVVKAESPLDISLLSMVTLQADQFLLQSLTNDGDKQLVNQELMRVKSTFSY